MSFDTNNSLATAKRSSTRWRNFFSRFTFGLIALAFITALAASSLMAQATVSQYFQGFEVDGIWSPSSTVTRVASGANGVTSRTGGFHGQVGTNSTRWGGYNSVFPAHGYITTVSIYLNVAGGYANDTRFDWDSAINDSSGNFRRDFIFNAGFYNSGDVTGPGAGTNRFVVSASFNSQPGSAFAKNPANSPIAITTSGWYTFRHRFYNNAGVLEVEMTILDSSNALVGTWIRSDITDTIATTGGNRYGWFDYNQFGGLLAIDDSERLNVIQTLYVDQSDGQAGVGGCGDATPGFFTIGAAIAASGPGDTITVCPGTYNESPQINKSLTIQSTGGRDVTTIQLPPSNAPGVGYLGSVYINSPTADVVIDGFTIIGNDAADPVLANSNVVSQASNSLSVTNSRLKVGAIDGGSNGDDGIGVITSYASGAGAVSVTNNEFMPVNTSAGRAFYINPATGNTFSFQNNQVTGNFVRNAATECGGSVSNNTVTGTGASGGFGASNFGGPPCGDPGPFTNNSVTGAATGIRIRGANNTVLTGNSFTGNGIGIWFDTDTVTGTVAHFNRIANNSSAGVDNGTASVFNAENNWWGCNYGPGASGAGCPVAANGVTGPGAGSVDSDPWLVLTPTPAGPTLINVAVPVYSNLWKNSAGATPGPGFVRDGTPSSFATDFGSVSPTTSTTTSGQTGTFFQAPTQGAANVSTTIDGQTVSTVVAAVTTLCPDVFTDVQTSLTGGVPVTIPVNVTDLTARNITSGQFTFTYNSPNAVVSSLPADISVTAGSVLPAGAVVTVNTDTPGLIYVSIFADPNPSNPQYLTGAGTLVNINMKVTGAIGATMSSALSAMKLYTVNPLAEHCLASVTSGSLTIISGTITGNVRYKLNTDLSGLVVKPNPGVAITAAGPLPIPTPAITNASGNYNMSGFAAGSYSITPSKAPKACGLTFNGIGSSDATAIARHAVFLRFFTPEQKLAAKVSGVGAEPNSLDASLVARFVVCLNTPGSKVGEWRFDPTGPVSVDTIAGGAYNFDSYLMGDVDGDWSNTGPLRPVVADPETAVRASLPSLKAGVGKLVNVPLRMENLRGQQVGSYDFDVEYDPAVIRPEEVAAEITGTVGEGLTVVSNSPSEGLLKVAVYGATPVSGDGVFANLKFRAIGEVGAKSPLTISGIRFNDGRTAVVVAAGELTLREAEGAVIKGRVVSPTGLGIRNAQISLTRLDGTVTRVTSGSFGFFEFENLQIGETYTINVQSKRYRFAAQVITLADNLAPLEMIAFD